MSCKKAIETHLEHCARLRDIKICIGGKYWLSTIQGLLLILHGVGIICMRQPYYTLRSILLGIRITVFSAIWASFKLWCDMFRSMSISQLRAECIKFLSEYHDKNLKLAS